MNVELRYLRDFAIAWLGLILATSVEQWLAAAWHLSHSTTVAILMATVVLGLIGFCVTLVRRGFADPKSGPARFVPAIVRAGLCIWNLYAACELVAAPGDRPARLDRVALDLTMALCFGVWAIPGAGVAIASAINRFCATDRQPAPFTPAGRRRGILRLSLVLSAVIAFIILRPQIGFVFALLAMWSGLTLAVIIIERYANLRSSSVAR